MDAMMEAGTNATAPLTAGVTSSQIDENLPPSAGPNRAQYDPRWDTFVSY